MPLISAHHHAGHMPEAIADIRAFNLSPRRHQFFMISHRNGPIYKDFNTLHARFLSLLDGRDFRHTTILTTIIGHDISFVFLASAAVMSLIASTINNTRYNAASRLMRDSRSTRGLQIASLKMHAIRRRDMPALVRHAPAVATPAEALRRQPPLSTTRAGPRRRDYKRARLITRHIAPKTILYLPPCTALVSH